MAANQVENSVLEEDFDKLAQFLNETDEEIEKDLIDIGSNVSFFTFFKNPGQICSVNRKKTEISSVMIMLLFCCNVWQKEIEIFHAFINLSFVIWCFSLIIYVFLNISSTFFVLLSLRM